MGKRIAWPCVHGKSEKYGSLHCISKLPNGRYLATMGRDGFLPGCASTFDEGEVVITEERACPNIQRQNAAHRAEMRRRAKAAATAREGA